LIRQQRVISVRGDDRCSRSRFSLEKPGGGPAALGAASFQPVQLLIIPGPKTFFPKSNAFDLDQGF
ncbi:MAG TPA: hypothetical protein PKJ77_01750, partial [Thermodesulfobacteriota bacterium]|nr:hypothetical protein [Thermodesulfobacteriota bacterium]